MSFLKVVSKSSELVCVCLSLMEINYMKLGTGILLLLFLHVDVSAE